MGRKLRGEKMVVITCSKGSNLGDLIWLPFVKSAEYLGMEYLGNIHTISGENNAKRVEDYISMVK